VTNIKQYVSSNKNWVIADWNFLVQNLGRGNRNKAQNISLKVKGSNVFKKVVQIPLLIEGDMANRGKPTLV